MTPTPTLRPLDTVALLDDAPEHGLLRGQVGTLVEALADGVWLVEFADDAGKAYALPAFRDKQLMALRFTTALAA